MRPRPNLSHPSRPKPTETLGPPSEGGGPGPPISFGGPRAPQNLTFLLIFTYFLHAFYKEFCTKKGPGPLKKAPRIEYFLEKY